MMKGPSSQPTSKARRSARRAASKFAPLPLAKALVREQLVRHFKSLVKLGTPVEISLSRTVSGWKFSASVRSLRRWVDRYEASGLAGLFEDKAGRSGTWKRR